MTIEVPPPSPSTTQSSSIWLEDTNTTEDQLFQQDPLRELTPLPGTEEAKDNTILKDYDGWVARTLKRKTKQWSSNRINRRKNSKPSSTPPSSLSFKEGLKATQAYNEKYSRQHWSFYRDYDC